MHLFCQVYGSCHKGGRRGKSSAKEFFTRGPYPNLIETGKIAAIRWVEVCLIAISPAIFSACLEDSVRTFSKKKKMEKRVSFFMKVTLHVHPIEN